MGTAYIDTTITVDQGGVFMFEVECAAEVDYELDNNQLYDFEITRFRFDKTEGRWNGEVFTRVTIATAWCPADLQEILIPFADYAAIEQRLIDHLTDIGELTLPASADLRADHHAAVR